MAGKRIKLSCENGHVDFWTITREGTEDLSTAGEQAYWSDFCALLELGSNESLLHRPGCLTCGGKVKAEVVDDG